MAVMYPRTSWQRERMIGNVPHRERTKIMRTPKLDDKCSWIQNVPLFVGISPQVCRIPSWWHSQSKGARGPWQILMIRWVDSPWHCQWWNWWLSELGNAKVSERALHVGLRHPLQTYGNATQVNSQCQKWICSRVWENVSCWFTMKFGIWWVQNGKHQKAPDTAAKKNLCCWTKGGFTLPTSRPATLQKGWSASIWRILNCREALCSDTAETQMCIYDTIHMYVVCVKCGDVNIHTYNYT